MTTRQEQHDRKRRGEESIEERTGHRPRVEDRESRKLALTLALKLRRADGLFQALRRRQDDEREARPFEKPNEIVILDIDDDVPATAVKSVFQTCAHAGFPTVLFLQSRR